MRLAVIAAALTGPTHANSALPDHTGSDMAGVFDRLADHDVRVIERGERFELAD